MSTAGFMFVAMRQGHLSSEMELSIEPFQIENHLLLLTHFGINDFPNALKRLGALRAVASENLKIVIHVLPCFKGDVSSFALGTIRERPNAVIQDFAAPRLNVDGRKVPQVRPLR